MHSLKPRQDDEANIHQKEAANLVSDETYDSIVIRFLKVKHEMLGEEGAAHLCHEWELKP